MFTDENVDIVEGLTEIARRHGRSLPELALARLIHVPGVFSVITGVTWPDQVRANARRATWQLDDELCSEIDAMAPCLAEARDTPSAAKGIA